MLPGDLDELDLREVKGAVQALFVYDSFRQFSKDMKKVTKEQQAVIDRIEDLRRLLKESVT